MGSYKIFKNYSNGIIKSEEFNSGKKLKSYRDLIKSEIDSGYSPVILTNSIMIEIALFLIESNANIRLQKMEFNEYLETSEVNEINKLIFEINKTSNTYLIKLFEKELSTLSNDQSIDIEKLNFLYYNDRIILSNNGVITNQSDNIDEMFKNVIHPVLERHLL